MYKRGKTQATRCQIPNYLIILNSLASCLCKVLVWLKHQRWNEGKGPLRLYFLLWVQVHWWRPFSKDPLLAPTVLSFSSHTFSRTFCYWWRPIIHYRTTFLMILQYRNPQLQGLLLHLFRRCWTPDCSHSSFRTLVIPQPLWTQNKSLSYKPYWLLCRPC